MPDHSRDYIHEGISTQNKQGLGALVNSLEDLF